EPAGTSVASWPAFEGYFQKGLDLHLVIETSAGLWRRKLTSGSSSGLEAYTVPMLTQLKLYPSTRPGDQLEPFIAAGVGLSLGIERTPAGSGPLGGGGSSQTAII